jgi:hypothetical protein
VRHPAHRRRLLAAIGAITVLAVAAGSFAVWSAASPGAKPVPLSTYRNSFMTFRYPATWSPSVWQTTELHFHPMLYLSTQPTHNPCRTSAAVGGGTSITCGAAVDRLAPGGVVVVWENRGYPGTTLADLPGRSTRIDGRPAKISTQRPGNCRGVGADEEISVAVARPVPSNWTSIDACLRGPGLAEQERQVQALLGSTRFLTP